jgi:hypothetical protein
MAAATTTAVETAITTTVEATTEGAACMHSSCVETTGVRPSCAQPTRVEPSFETGLTARRVAPRYTAVIEAAERAGMDTGKPRQSCASIDASIEYLISLRTTAMKGGGGGEWRSAWTELRRPLIRVHWEMVEAFASSIEIVAIGEGSAVGDVGSVVVGHPPVAPVRISLGSRTNAKLWFNHFMMDSPARC